MMIELFLSDGLNFLPNFKFSIEENLNLQRRRIIDRATRIYAYNIRIIDRYMSSRYSTDQVISPLLPFLYHECLSDMGSRGISHLGAF